MIQYTEKAIQQTFQEMLTEMPFDKITVTELVKRCEISPNTFYYHYEDIYDLLDHWLAAEVSGYIPTDAAHWQTSAKALLHYCQDNKRLIYHIYNSISRERMEQFFFSRIYDVFEQNLRARPEAEGVSAAALRFSAFFSGFCGSGWTRTWTPRWIISANWPNRLFRRNSGSRRMQRSCVNPGISEKSGHLRETVPCVSPLIR